MKISRQSSLCSHALAFSVIIALITMTSCHVFADYNGTHVGCTGDTIPAGQDLTYDITVQNTGSTTWYGGSYPAWVHRVYSIDCSWSPQPPWSYTTGYQWTSVSGSATRTASATFSAGYLPTTPGTYTFWVYAYYPTNSSGSYSLMVDSPRQVTFSISGSINSDPTDISLSSSSVDENEPIGTTVGILSTTDPNTGDTFTYTLVSGAGSMDNASFMISGSTLQTAASFNYEAKSSYSVRIRTTDQGNLWFEKIFIINIEDIPEILKGDINNDGNVDLGDAIVALRLLVGLQSQEPINALADVNGDGKIGLEEVLYILRATGGLVE